MKLREIEVRVDILDVLYAELHRCRRLCGGRGRRKENGEPDHDCDERCHPHRCRPLEPASIDQIHSILRRAFNFAVKWRWMKENPARLATVPRNTAEMSDPPTPAEAMWLLEAAEASSPDLAVFVWLVMVTGARGCRSWCGCRGHRAASSARSAASSDRSSRTGMANTRRVPSGRIVSLPAPPMGPD